MKVYNTKVRCVKWVKKSMKILNILQNTWMAKWCLIYSEKFDDGFDYWFMGYDYELRTH